MFIFQSDTMNKKISEKFQYNFLLIQNCEVTIKLKYLLLKIKNTTWNLQNNTKQSPNGLDIHNSDICFKMPKKITD